ALAYNLTLVTNNRRNRCPFACMLQCLQRKERAMSQELRRVAIDDVARDVAGFFERVRRGEALVVEDRDGAVAVVRPARRPELGRPPTAPTVPTPEAFFDEAASRADTREILRRLAQ